MKLPAELKIPASKITIKNVFYGVMLGILILQKNIQKKLETKTKNLLMIMMKLNFLYEKMILLRLEKRTTFALMYFVTKMGWFFQNTFQIKNLKTQYIYYSELMVINRIICTLKTLTDLCFTKQRIKTKNGFVEAVYSILVINMC